MQKVESIQVLRAVAALGVAYSHATHVFGTYQPVGAAGVDLFFVISGFIMAGQSREGFMRKRLTRILPLYYLVLPIFLVDSLLSGRASVGGWLSALTFWPVWGQFYHPQMGVAWSLCFEMLFYLSIWTVFRGVNYLWLLTAYSLAMILAVVTGLALFRYLGSPMILEFLFGVLIYQLPRNRLAAFVALFGGVLVFAILSVVGTGHLEQRIILEPTAWLRPLLFGIPAALLVFGAVHFDWSKLRLLTFLGDASYSLYLTHILTIAALVWLMPHPLVAVAACAAVGAIVYLKIEKPVLEGLRRYRHQQLLVRRPARL